MMLFCDHCDSIISSLKLSDNDSLEYLPIPNLEEWRIGSLKELLSTRLGIIDVPGFTTEEIYDLINIVCVS